MTKKQLDTKLRNKNTFQFLLRDDIPEFELKPVFELLKKQLDDIIVDSFMTIKKETFSKEYYFGTKPTAKKIKELSKIPRYEFYTSLVSKLRLALKFPRKDYGILVLNTPSSKQFFFMLNKNFLKLHFLSKINKKDYLFLREDLFEYFLKNELLTQTRKIGDHIYYEFNEIFYENPRVYFDFNYTTNQLMQFIKLKHEDGIAFLTTKSDKDRLKKTKIVPPIKKKIILSKTLEENNKTNIL
jgi:hypothetical protein